jgi:hypothetical protein
VPACRDSCEKEICIILYTGYLRKLVMLNCLKLPFQALKPDQRALCTVFKASNASLDSGINASILEKAYLTKPGSDTPHNERPTSDKPGLFIDRLLEIGAEINLMNEIRNIRKELGLVAKVFQDQRVATEDLQPSIMKQLNTKCDGHGTDEQLRINKTHL